MCFQPQKKVVSCFINKFSPVLTPLYPTLTPFSTPFLLNFLSCIPLFPYPPFYPLSSLILLIPIMHQSLHPCVAIYISKKTFDAESDETNIWGWDRDCEFLSSFKTEMRTGQDLKQIPRYWYKTKTRLLKIFTDGWDLDQDCSGL